MFYVFIVLISIYRSTNTITLVLHLFRSCISPIVRVSIEILVQIVFAEKQFLHFRVQFDLDVWESSLNFVQITGIVFVEPVWYFSYFVAVQFKHSIWFPQPEVIIVASRGLQKYVVALCNFGLVSLNTFFDFWHEVLFIFPSQLGACTFVFASSAFVFDCLPFAWTFPYNLGMHGFVLNHLFFMIYSYREPAGIVYNHSLNIGSLRQFQLFKTYVVLFFLWSQNLLLTFENLILVREVDLVVYFTFPLILILHIIGLVLKGFVLFVELKQVLIDVKHYVLIEY